MKNTLLAGIMIAACLLTGCANSSVIKLGSVASFPATDPEKIEILASSPLRSFDEVAVVTGEMTGSNQSATNKALNAMRKQAAKIGANAIIINTAGTSGGGFVKAGAALIPTRTTVLSGTAIRYKEPST